MGPSASQVTVAAALEVGLSAAVLTWVVAYVRGRTNLPSVRARRT